MTIFMGPVLSFRGWDPQREQWKLSAIVVTDEAACKLSWSKQREQAKDAAATVLWESSGRKVCRFEFSPALDDEKSSFTYSIGGKSYEVTLPPKSQAPRMLYASCNGFSSLKAMKNIKDKNGLWTRMAEKHALEPYHLLVLGGDQVYADSMWEVVGSMKSWAELSWEKGNKAKFTATMQSQLERFYFDLYTTRWAQPEVKQILASIPSLMMWDDHDIIDGWGSYPKERQNCPVFQGLWPIARKAFAVFQQQLPSTTTSSGISEGFGFSFGHVLPGMAVLGIDMRSERTSKTVLSTKHWDKIYEWLDKLPVIDHLFVLSSIPVVYPGFDTLESLLGFLPGQQEIEDDLRDHWNSRPHKGERLRMIHRLIDFARVKEIRPTLLSGDVHVAAVGVIESGRTSQDVGDHAVVNQLISSAIVHPGPPAAVMFALRHLFDSEDEVDRGICARMIEFPGTQTKFIGKRNFLALEPDPKSTGVRFWANWIVEGEDDPYVKVIHPPEKLRQIH